LKEFLQYWEFEQPFPKQGRIFIFRSCIPRHLAPWVDKDAPLCNTIFLFLLISLLVKPGATLLKKSIYRDASFVEILKPPLKRFSKRATCKNAFIGVAGIFSHLGTRSNGPYKPIYRGGYSTNRPYKSICRGGLKTVPTNT